ncbi:uncharacterized protein MONBRDRAFT_13314 [Monosiga brevicollis MX1]|uniref:2-amino-3-carboxymuconate-6-semialdehyde decarboxylase n=1 Tax=Monosiga brevicollis TaxID=81824 RepID=A9UQR6_MONBE|nr:uncharacterized protein MONBRDRAFT_13314 [Monosiga brevicollis MX1]EDQ92644.1 predicted protein [Monosiga brevicollis MX1]|eukprot:XP_001742406.1 hypothetical protein [Monosiga brevicollis MX1]
MDGVKKVDFHTHILPREIPNWKEEFGYGGFIRLDHLENGNANMMKDDGKFFREIEPNCWDPEVRLKEMAETGVDVQVICTVPVMFNYHIKAADGLKVARFLNDDVAKTCATYPDKFIGLGTLPMQDPALAAEELRRCRNELHLAGVQVGSHINKWNLDAKELEPFWTACEETDAAVLIHPWDMEQTGRYADYWAPWLVGMPAETTLAIMTILMGGVLERHPKLKLCFAHGGGSFAFTLGRIQHGYNVRPDLCAKKCKRDPRSFVGQFWVDSAVHDADALAFLVKIMGEDRVIMGSDYPFPLGEHHPGKEIETHTQLDEALKSRLLARNCLQFLGKI